MPQFCRSLQFSGAEGTINELDVLSSLSLYVVDWTSLIISSQQELVNIAGRQVVLRVARPSN